MTAITHNNLKRNYSATDFNSTMRRDFKVLCVLQLTQNLANKFRLSTVLLLKATFSNIVVV